MNNVFFWGCLSAVFVFFLMRLSVDTKTSSFEISKGIYVDQIIKATVAPIQATNSQIQLLSPSPIIETTQVSQSPIAMIESTQVSPSPIANHEPEPIPLPRVAVAVTGTLRHAVEWGQMISALPVSTRANLTIFITVYGDPSLSGSFTTNQNDKIPLIGLLHNASSLFPATVAYFAPTTTTTWTSGRNELLQLMYAHEVSRGEQFTYWVTADGDASHVDCALCPPTRPPDYSSAACCWDKLVGSTLNSDGLAFAVVGTVLSKEELSSFGGTRSNAANATPIHQYLFRDCMDAQTQAVHRDAVPIVHPFHEDFDYLTWTASQGMQFAYTSGCLQGGCALIEGDFHVWDNEHSKSYASFEYSTLWAFLEKKNPQLWGHVIIPERICVAPGHIRNNRQDDIIYITSGQKYGETVSNIPVSPRVRWNETCAFTLCNASRYHNFIMAVGKGVPEAPRRKDINIGWVWGWQALSLEPIPYWSENTNLSGFSKDCHIHRRGISYH